MLPLGEYIQVIIGIMAIFSPFTAIPIFVSLTQNHTRSEQMATAKTAAFSAFIAGLVSIWIGQYVLGFFGISIPSFRIAGGILLLLMAIPLIAGPGAISTIIIFTQKNDGVLHLLMMSLIILCVALYIWLALRMSTIITKKFGLTGINIISRVMGLILASISIEFIVSGLLSVFPILGLKAL